MYLESIKEDIDNNVEHLNIIRKIYLTYPTKALVGNEKRQYEILNEISEYFNIPIMNIHVCGSAKTGYSFHKKTEFDRKLSDLDIAIIDPNLFLQYSEWVFKFTKGFTDRTGFTTYDQKSNYQQYVSYIAKGIFRPDLMPSSKKRLNWLKFFGQLSTKNKDLFKSINAGIYMSQTFFEHKQISNINEFIINKPL